MPAQVSGDFKMKESEIRTLVEAHITFLVYDPSHGMNHVLLTAISASNVHTALDRDIRVRDAGSKQLPESSQHKCDRWRNPLLLLQDILQLLEDRVLEYGVDDQHQSWHNASKQSLWAFLSDQGKQCAHRRWGFRCLHTG